MRVVKSIALAFIVVGVVDCHERSEEPPATSASIRVAKSPSQAPKGLDDLPREVVAAMFITLQISTMAESVPCDMAFKPQRGRVR